MCVSLSVIRCNNKHLHLQAVYKEVRIRKTESFIIRKIDSILSQFKPIYIIKIYFSKFVFNIIQHSTIACKASCIGVFPHACCTHNSSTLLEIGYPRNTE